jgi:hypothetical protein
MDEPRPYDEIAFGWALSKIPFAGDLAKEVFQAANDWRRYNAERTGREIAEIVGPEELFERASDNTELAALLVQVLELAERTGFRAKRRLLVEAAANAFKNDEAIDPAILVARALSQLDTVHIRALARLAALSHELGPWPDDYLPPDTTIDGGSAKPDPLMERTEKMMKAGQQIPLPVLVALVNAGVVMQSTNVFGGGTHLHDVSDFGRQLLKGLQEADPDDKSIRWVPPA